MRVLIVIIGMVASLLMGCEGNMNNNFKVFERLEKARNSTEEAEALEELISVLRSKETPFTIGVIVNNIELPITKLGDNLDSDLRVNISFDEEGSFEWKPFDNKNIFILLRE